VKPRDLLMQLSAGRIAIGAAMLAKPPLATSGWVGRVANRPGGHVLARALGARDAALGALTLAALRSGQPVRPLVLAALVCDGTDLIATHAARDSLPRGAVPLIYALAGGALLVGAANLTDSQAPQA
jgi:hypothetical protein